MTRTVGKAHAHESAHLHVAGKARYTDDLPEPRGTLYAAVGTSSRQHARIASLDLAPVRAAPGVVAVFTAQDIPGKNNHGPIIADDPLMAEEMVEYVGQVIFTVVATSTNAARRAARLAVVEYEDRPAINSIADAEAAQADLVPPEQLSRGDAEAALAAAPHRLQGSFAIGGQDHFYLEGHIAVALPGEDGGMTVWSSTQHPTEGQHLVAECLGLKSNQVQVECRRMGGGFGGKETQPALFGCLAAVAAQRLGRPVKLRVDRDADMTITGKRHPYEVRYDVGFDDQGKVCGLALAYLSDCGRSADLSGPVNARTLFHADNCYFFDQVSIHSRRFRTHRASNTAFRGFGGPQGMVGIEVVLDAVARHCKLDPLAVRLANLYGPDGRDTTPYGMAVDHQTGARLIEELLASSNYHKRRAAVAAANAAGGPFRYGLALTPVKFGISFTARHYNQAGALLHIYRDGSLLLNHGGTEMGQGLFTKVAQVVAECFDVPLQQVQCSAADTSKVPNTSATAASAGTDLNGMAAQAAARTLRERLVAHAAESHGVAPEAVSFEAGEVLVGEQRIPFAELVDSAYMARVPLSATGFYRTPKIDYDPKTLMGRPFYYFAWGAAVSEVAIDTRTGESKLLRVDILHDVGKSLNPAIDRGQIEGGFMQGVGWLLSEELVWNGDGRLTTHAPSTYKIPTASDWPEQFNVEIAAWSENAEETIYRSKAVGEPPLMLAMSAFLAVRDAVASCGDQPFRLDAPATPEAVLRALAECLTS